MGYLDKPSLRLAPLPAHAEVPPEATPNEFPVKELIECEYGVPAGMALEPNAFESQALIFDKPSLPLTLVLSHPQVPAEITPNAIPVKVPREKVSALLQDVQHEEVRSAFPRADESSAFVTKDDAGELKVQNVEIPVKINGSIEPQDVSNRLDFLAFVGHLKEVSRTGWVRSGIDDAESVADHVYRVACMCFLLNPADSIDQTKCIKMALIHDLGTSIIGDVVTEGMNPDKITKEEKIQKEQDAIYKIAYSLGGVAGEEIVSLWEELEKGVTPEALHVRDMSKFEMVLQANTYEQAQAAQLDDFFNTTLNVFKTPLFQSLDAEVRKRRARRSKGSAD